MNLSNLKPAPGSVKNRKRVARGQGSGQGGTATRGHNGQKSRSGYSRKIGFEGGQMPLQMRLPKFGFSSRVGRITAEVRTSELNKVDGGLISIESLRKARVITANIKRVKVMLSGEVVKKFTVEGVGVSKGAKEAIEKAGGKVIEVKATEPTKKTEPEAKAKKVTKKVKIAEAKEAATVEESSADKASDGEGKADKE